MNTEEMTSREKAGMAARIAAYGSATARTPADYTLKEAIQKADIERPKAKRKKWERNEPTEATE